ncbi:hypothetical protein MKX01_031617 [Papaver californicum]|nr:hypothetical protein MKX01_031617 [Papaver californicum]
MLQLKGLSLTGTLPEEFSNLPFLQEIDLSRNYLNGTIPKSWSALPLTILSLLANSISGSIPKEIGDIITLLELNFQDNRLGGPLPPDLSKLKSLRRFRIDGTSISGKIPDFIGNWTNIGRLEMQGTSMEGPIPSAISLLKNLKTMDLSFNRLDGTIPDSLQQLEKLSFVFLTNNSLTGPTPSWVVNTKRNFDISYNNFKGSAQSSCQEPNLNKISSFSSLQDNSTPWCLKKDLPCPSEPKYYELYINCGGPAMNFDGNNYEADLSTMGPSTFFWSNGKWASSSKGIYIKDLYMTARIAPVSLKYYGLCLRPRNYNVTLHFAEIMFPANQPINGLGERIFDVSIQGKSFLKDFNIAEEAKGVGKRVAKEINIDVTNGTLEIHLYWRRKGTSSIPFRSVYGPLISAITVKPNFDPKTDTGRMSVGVILGIVASSCVLVLSILAALWKKGYLGGKDLENKDRSKQQLATLTLLSANKIGEGGFGPVYKGQLHDGSIIAVKQLSSKSKQGNREFVNEIGMISALQHQNLVKLFGCCIEGNQLLLIYEYMENNCLARALFGKDEQRLNLNWPTRHKICLEIAKGLAYLHEESRLKIVHRDIKATNVLLDKDLSAKISDFGLAKLEEDENTHISTRIAGTVGYMAPEYAMRGYLTYKADVYSFGIVALEIVSWKSNTNYRPKEEFVYLLDWAYVLQEQGNLLDLVDPILGSKYSKKEALKMLNIALLCTNPSPSLRPLMSSVVSMLEGRIPVQAPIVGQNSKADEMRLRAFERRSYDSEPQTSSASQDIQTESRSNDGPWINSSLLNQDEEDDEDDKYDGDDDETREYSSQGKLLPDQYDKN